MSANVKYPEKNFHVFTAKYILKVFHPFFFFISFVHFFNFKCIQRPKKKKKKSFSITILKVTMMLSIFVFRKSTRNLYIKIQSLSVMFISILKINVSIVQKHIFLLLFSRLLVVFIIQQIYFDRMENMNNNNNKNGPEQKMNPKQSALQQTKHETRTTMRRES